MNNIKQAAFRHYLEDHSCGPDLDAFEEWLSVQHSKGFYWGSD